MPHSEKTTSCIEAICQSGCLVVRAVIESLEAGQLIPQTKGMSPEQVDMVLNELKAVMSVYDERCEQSG